MRPPLRRLRIRTDGPQLVTLVGDAYKVALSTEKGGERRVARPGSERTRPWCGILKHA
jgi:hypothetical protein